MSRTTLLGLCCAALLVSSIPVAATETEVARDPESVRNDLSEVLRLSARLTRDLDLDEVRAAMLEVDGVVAVHDLHAWVITSGMASLSAHVEVADDPFRDDLGASMLASLRSCVQDRFSIVHTTFQLECTAYSAMEPPTHP